MYNLGLVTQNLCLAAHENGLGTVIVELFDHDKVNTILNIPDGYEAVTMIPLGNSAKPGKKPEQKE